MPDDEEPQARPALYTGGREVPVVDSFRLHVEGEIFDVEVDARGGAHYSWVSGPNAGYGFGSSGSSRQATREQHSQSIRSSPFDDRSGNGLHRRRVLTTRVCPNLDPVRATVPHGCGPADAVTDRLAEHQPAPDERR